MEHVVTSEVIGGKNVHWREKVEISLARVKSKDCETPEPSNDMITRDNWVLAGTERDTGKSFAVFLGEKDKIGLDVIEPLIVKHIRPGTLMISESWPFYDNMKNLVDRKGKHLDYEHLTYRRSTRNCY